jgi:hypothetical protein
MADNPTFTNVLATGDHAPYVGRTASVLID